MASFLCLEELKERFSTIKIINVRLIIYSNLVNKYTLKIFIISFMPDKCKLNIYYFKITKPKIKFMLKMSTEKKFLKFV